MNIEAVLKFKPEATQPDYHLWLPELEEAFDADWIEARGKAENVESMTTEPRCWISYDNDDKPEQYTIERFEMSELAELQDFCKALQLDYFINEAKS
jgi:hypothetical protein